MREMDRTPTGTKKPVNYSNEKAGQDYYSQVDAAPNIDRLEGVGPETYSREGAGPDTHSHDETGP